MTNSFNTLLVKIENARNQLNVAIEKISPQVDIYPSWKLKQLIDHITGWDELVASAFQAHSRGEFPAKMEAKGINEYNEKSVSEWSEFSLESSRQAYDAARNKVLKAIREIPAEKLDQKFPAPWGGSCTVGSVLKILISHELEHAKHIEESMVTPTK